MSIYISQIQNIAIFNKYTKIYINICSKAIFRGTNKKIVKSTLGYIESHHIIPKSFGLVHPKIKENQVFLTAKEHFICHHLLTKMFEGKIKAKMFSALLHNQEIKNPL